MRLFFFTARYPVPYKPYYDTQFVDFLRRGHDLAVFSAGSLDNIVNDKVRQYGLRGRTVRYPAALREIPKCVRSYLGSLGTRPLSNLVSGVRLLRVPGGPKERLLRMFRLLSLNCASPDILFVHGLGTAVRFDWLGKAFPGVSLAMYYHGGEVPSGADLAPSKISRTFGQMDIVFTNTEFSRQHAIDRGCPPEKVHILPVGFALEDFDPPPRKSSSSPLRLLSASRMSEEKGFIFALKAVKTLVDGGIRDIEYSLTGEGYIRPRLERFVRETGLEKHVRFLGTLSTKGVLEAMARSHVLLLPSIQVGNWVENQACAVQEAMLQRCLVVTSRTGGIPESIPKCMQPFSVPPGDSEALASALRKVCTLAPERRESLADACRAFVMERYDISKLNDQMLRMIREARVQAASQRPEPCPHGSQG